MGRSRQQKEYIRFKLRDMISPKLQASLADGHHHSLNQLIGKWKGETKTWFEGPEPVDVSPNEGSIRTLFDGRFVMHEYKSGFQGKETEGIAIYGYYLKTQQFQCVWMDTFHMGTGILFSQGEAEGPFYNVKGSYEAGETNEQLWGWRTEIKIVSNDELVITAYNIEPSGEETKATETVYKRVAE